MDAAVHLQVVSVPFVGRTILLLRPTWRRHTVGHYISTFVLFFFVDMRIATYNSTAVCPRTARYGRANEPGHPCWNSQFLPPIPCRHAHSLLVSSDLPWADGALLAMPFILRCHPLQNVHSSHIYCLLIRVPLADKEVPCSSTFAPLFFYYYCCRGELRRLISFIRVRVASVIVQGEMPVAGKGPQSNFAAAAKVLFESAQKSGAVKPLEKSGLEYAQQLKKIQNQSKKRGGSLGGVSYKVAEFLAAQRTPPPVNPSKRRSNVTMARKVPLIVLPTDTKEAARPSVPVRPETPRLSKEVATASTGTAGSLSSQISPLPEIARGDEKLSYSASTPSATQVDIAEDEPLFQTRPVEPARKKLESLVHSVPAPTMAAEQASSTEPKARKKVQAPIIAIPVAPEQGDKAENVQPPELDASAPSSISMDIWEQQREREIERLQQKQEEIEQRRLAAQLEAEHQTLGAQWVEQRTVMIRGHSLTPDQQTVQSIMRATDIEGMLKGLQQIISSGAKSSTYLPAAVSAVVYQISRMKPLDREEAAEKLLGALEKAKIPDELMKNTQLSLSRGDRFFAIYSNLPAPVKEKSSKSIALKAIPVLMQHGQWQEALQVVEQSCNMFVDRNSQLALTVLMNTRQLDPEVKATVRSHIVRTLTSSGSLSKHAKLALAISEEGPNRRSNLQQLAAGADADENIYAQLILRTSVEDVPALLTEMEKRGLNKDDPIVLKSLVFKTLDPENPTATFQEIEQQSRQIGMRPFHLVAAAKAAQLHPDNDTARRAAEIMLSADATYAAPALRKLLPVLYERGMFNEVVALADHFSEFLPLATTFPRAVAFINESLEHVGRSAVTDLRVKDINFVPASAKSHKDGEAPRVAVAPTADLSTLTEKMLVYAKERQWAEALSVIETLNAPSSDDAAALTLIYNCALSAAVDHPEVLQVVYSTMKERNVAVNATTANTVLSSHSKAGNWKEAIDFFDSVPSAIRDSNTFLVQLSLLGKHNLWAEASAVYEQMRKAINKPPASMFAVAIGAASSHNWSVTLKMFQDMLKLHGANVKENVVNQVVRCLEQNNRTVELSKLEKDLAKRKKKGKK